MFPREHITPVIIGAALAASVSRVAAIDLIVMKLQLIFYFYAA